MGQDATASPEASERPETSATPETAATNDLAVAFAALGAELKGLQNREERLMRPRSHVHFSLRGFHGSFERDLIRARTGEGRARDKAQGVKVADLAERNAQLARILAACRTRGVFDR